MSEYDRAAVELAFTQNGFNKVQETDGIAIYQRNTYPGDEIVVVWSASWHIEWKDIQRYLEDAGIPHQPIRNCLDKKS